MSTCTFLMVMDYRSSAGYTPLDIAFVVADDKGKDKGVVEMLDSDRQLLPRKEDSILENDLIEVWKHQKELNPCMVFHCATNVN